MHIHTVKAGDTIFKIARQYSTSAMKIIENNELQNPDRLVVGQKLLIITPTRTHTVRGADTVARILERFKMKRRELLRKNPMLRGTDKIYHGEVLTIKCDASRYGAATANGYYYKGTSLDRVCLCLPYMSYITVSVAKRDGKNIRLLFDDSEILKLARYEGKLPLMRIYDTCTDIPSGYIDEIILLAKTHGYSGIMLAAYRLMKEETEKFPSFLMELKKKLMEVELSLFLEIDANSELDLSTIKDIADGYTVVYEKSSLDTPPSFALGEKRIFETLCESVEPSKVYIDIPAFAYSDGEEILKSEAHSLALASGRNIEYDEEKMLSYFTYNKYRGGKKEETSVKFEPLENTKAKLEMISELGLMGISFDIMHTPIEELVMFDAMFEPPVIYPDM